MSIALSLLIGVIVVLAITALTGYFVAQEFAFMAVDRSRMGAAAEKGDPVAERVLGVTKRTSFMLSGAQLGITVTTLIVGYVAEPLIGRALGDLLGLASVPQAVGVGDLDLLVGGGAGGGQSVDGRRVITRHSSCDWGGRAATRGWSLGMIPIFAAPPGLPRSSKNSTLAL